LEYKRMKPAGWFLHQLKHALLLFLVALLLGGAPGAAAQTITPPENPVFLPVVIQRGHTSLVPLPTDSYYFYMKTDPLAKARALGCQLGERDKALPGKQESLVILAFGITKYQDGQYGASGMARGGFSTVDQIAEAVQQFGLGYWDCTDTDFDSRLTVAVGTNNYNHPGEYFQNLSVTFEHGRAWAQMVNKIHLWFQNVCPNRCNGQVSVMGANDIELAWSSPDDAYNWVKGYDSASNFPLINFGAAEGCPNACGGGGFYWTKDKVMRVTSEGSIYVLPQIYRPDGHNAKQWHELSKYSVTRFGRPIDFAGALSNYGACQQYPNDKLCKEHVIDNTPEQAWTQLNNLVNGATVYTHDDLPYLTDIRWTD
jgi:hypothetical protein